MWREEGEESTFCTWQNMVLVTRSSQRADTAIVAFVGRQKAGGLLGYGLKSWGSPPLRTTPAHPHPPSLWLRSLSSGLPGIRVHIFTYLAIHTVAVDLHTWLSQENVSSWGWCLHKGPGAQAGVGKYWMNRWRTNSVLLKRGPYGSSLLIMPQFSTFLVTLFVRVSLFGRLFPLKYYFSSRRSGSRR